MASRDAWNAWPEGLRSPQSSMAKPVLWRLEATVSTRDDVIKWKNFPRHWSFVRGIHLSLPVTRIFDVFFDLRLNKRLSKQSWGWWFETLSSPLWRHCNGVIGNRNVSSFVKTKWVFLHSDNCATVDGSEFCFAPTVHYIDLVSCQPTIFIQTDHSFVWIYTISVNAAENQLGDHGYL